MLRHVCQGTVPLVTHSIGERMTVQPRIAVVGSTKATQSALTGPWWARYVAARRPSLESAYDVSPAWEVLPVYKGETTAGRVRRQAHSGGRPRLTSVGLSQRPCVAPVAQPDPGGDDCEERHDEPRQADQEGAEDPERTGLHPYAGPGHIPKSAGCQARSRGGAYLRPTWPCQRQKNGPEGPFRAQSVEATSGFEPLNRGVAVSPPVSAGVR